MAKPKVTEERLQRLIDELEITQVMFSYGQLIDQRKFPEWEAIFTEDQIITYPEPLGSYVGREGLGEWGKNAVAPFDFTQHFISNDQVQVDGDRATARMNVIGYHTPSKGDLFSHLEAGGYYDLEFSRTDEGWKIRRLTLVHEWASDGTAPDDEQLIFD